LNIDRMAKTAKEGVRLPKRNHEFLVGGNETSRDWGREKNMKGGGEG